MAFHTYKVEHYGKLSSGAYTTTPTELDNILSINVNLQDGANADSFSIMLFNDGDNEFEDISIDDRVRIYGSLDGSNFTMLIDGIVNEKNQKGGTDGNIITITGLNRLEKLFNALVSTTGENTQHTASYWVKNILDQVNNFNNYTLADRGIKYVYQGVDQDGNPSSKPDTIQQTSGNISFVRDFEKAFNLVEELSKPEYTGGVNYVFYADTENYFHFEERSSSVGADLVYGEDILSLRTTKGMFDIVNFIIMNGGKSPRGMSILQMDYNSESIAKFGWKVKLVNEGIASAIGTEEIRLMRQRNVYDEDAPEFPTSYPFTTSWGVETTSNSTYNKAFVNEVLARAKEKIRVLLNKNGGATYKVDLSMNPSFGYALYNKHLLVIPVNGLSTYYNWSVGVKLRISSINYSFTENGWSTDLSMEQDMDESEGGSI